MSESTGEKPQDQVWFTMESHSIENSTELSIEGEMPWQVETDEEELARQQAEQEAYLLEQENNPPADPRYPVGERIETETSVALSLEAWVDNLSDKFYMSSGEDDLPESDPQQVGSSPLRVWPNGATAFALGYPDDTARLLLIFIDDRTGTPASDTEPIITVEGAFLGTAFNETYVDILEPGQYHIEAAADPEYQNKITVRFTSVKSEA